MKREGHVSNQDIQISNGTEDVVMSFIVGQPMGSLGKL